jgi:probable nicotinate-nucleotide adenylyltransferase
LDALKRTYPQHTFHLVIGSDNWRLFHRWYKSERILAENHLLVYPRPGYPVEAASLPQNVRTVSSPIFEISSTFIRRAMEEGKDVRYFLHPAVCDELKRMQNESLN